MKSSYKHLIVFAIFIVLNSCTTYPTLTPPASATSSGPRTLILDGEEYVEDKVGGFISWYCKDYIDGGPILLEVGYFGGRKLEGFGFILFDGGYSGIIVDYERDGLNHSWNWAPDENYAYDYTFVIEPKGTGHYFDFSSVKPGEAIKTTRLFKCYKR